ncbi:MAG: glutamate-5-semialdehyde dehydrogenase [Desulfobacteraceae bacterium]|nr:MAG: glutamate-5-semialdehyde dehydrogenase [Desulfobacteraceae bacterium]
MLNARDMASRAKQAGHQVAHAETEQKNQVLRDLARLIHENRENLFKENQKDIKQAEKSGLSKSLIDRLLLDEKVIEEIQASLLDVAGLPDPVGAMTSLNKRPNGLAVGRMRIPIGVILIIYESRPNVTVEAFSLCLKSGNSVILKGGSEAIHSNRALAGLIAEALKENNLPVEIAQFVETGDRAFIYELLTLNELIDLVIPRGGEALIRNVVEKSRIPVLKHYKGVCHIYIDESADPNMGYEICLNAKVQKPSACNALETLLVHQAIAEIFLPEGAKRLQSQGVRLKGCERARAILQDIEKADEQDWYEEYLDLVLAVKVVNDINEAISHIRKYGSDHTEAIITQNYDRAWKFVREINSSLVLVNASTRFNDGFQLGLGAEMGISTTKLHAFGPMGLEELTVSKFVAFGEGQIRE